MKNGNHNITIINWNKGAAKLLNRINIIQNIIQTHNPHIIALHELNFQKNDDLADDQYPGLQMGNGLSIPEAWKIKNWSSNQKGHLILKKD